MVKSKFIVRLKNLVTSNQQFLFLAHDQSSQKPKYLEMRVFGETNFDFKETDCKVCLKCGCKAKDYIRAEDVSWFNNFEWFGLRERSRGK